MLWLMSVRMVVTMQGSCNDGAQTSLKQDEQPGQDAVCAVGLTDAATCISHLQQEESDCPVIDIPDSEVNIVMQNYQAVFGVNSMPWQIDDGMTGFLDPELWRLRFINAVFYTQTNVDEQTDTVHTMTVSCPSANASMSAPQTMPESCPVTRRLRKRKPSSLRIAYDPQLANHCWFQCVMRALHLPDEEGAIMAFREMLAQRWEEHLDWLSAVAKFEGYSETEYLTKLRTTLWGGAPEMMLMNHIYGIDFEVVDAAQNVLFATNGPKPIRLLRHRNHFYLLHGQPEVRDIARMIARGQERRVVETPTASSCYRGGMPLTLTDNTGVTITVQTVEEEDSLHEDAPLQDRPPLLRRKRGKPEADSHEVDEQRSIAKKKEILAKLNKKWAEKKDMDPAVVKNQPASSASSAGPMSSTAAGPPERAPRWIFHFQGEPQYPVCILCMAWSQSARLQGKKHQKRLAMYQRATEMEQHAWLDETIEQLQAYSKDNEQHWIETLEDASQRCMVCGLPADQQHRDSLSHRLALGRLHLELDRAEVDSRQCEDPSGTAKSKSAAKPKSQGVRAGMPGAQLALGTALLLMSG